MCSHPSESIVGRRKKEMRAKRLQPSSAGNGAQKIVSPNPRKNQKKDMALLRVHRFREKDTCRKPFCTSKRRAGQDVGRRTPAVALATLFFGSEDPDIVQGPEFGAPSCEFCVEFKFHGGPESYRSSGRGTRTGTIQYPSLRLWTFTCPWLSSGFFSSSSCRRQGKLVRLKSGLPLAWMVNTSARSPSESHLPTRYRSKARTSCSAPVEAVEILSRCRVVPAGNHNPRLLNSPETVLVPDCVGSLFRPLGGDRGGRGKGLHRGVGCVKGRVEKHCKKETGQGMDGAHDNILCMVFRRVKTKSLLSARSTTAGRCLEIVLAFGESRAGISVSLPIIAWHSFRAGV